MNIKELDERIKQLKDLVASANDTIKLAEEMVGLAEKEMDKLADQKKGEPKFERVEYKKQYFGVRVNSEIDYGVFTEIGDVVDNAHFRHNNYFHTEERAQEVADKINLLLKLERLHDIYCPNYVPDWRNCWLSKYYIYQDKSMGNIWICGAVSTESDIVQVYFPTEDIAKKVCDILNAEERSNNT